jgi:hypothetical protein
MDTSPTGDLTILSLKKARSLKAQVEDFGTMNTFTEPRCALLLWNCEYHAKQGNFNFITSLFPESNIIQQLPGEMNESQFTDKLP